MRKWLVIGGLALAALGFLLLYEVRTPDAAPTPHAKLTNQTDGLAIANQMTPVAKPAVAPPEAAGDASKIDVHSDRFAYAVDEKAPNVVGRAAMKCYQPKTEAERVHRHAKLVIGYKVKIKDGEVSFVDVAAKSSTLHNPKLEACMLAEVAKTHWHNAKLPDYLEDDETSLRPEDGGRKYRDIVDDNTGPIEKVKLKQPLAPNPRFDDEDHLNDQ